MFSHDITSAGPAEREILGRLYLETISRQFVPANSNDPAHARPALLNLPAGRDTAAGAAAEGNGI